MTPKEKAKELYDKYFMKMESGIDNDHVWICMALNHGMAKSCALIAVDEILDAVTTIADKKYEFWQQVKQELKLL